jgi:CRISPR-associated protein Csa3
MENYINEAALNTSKGSGNQRFPGLFAWQKGVDSMAKKVLIATLYKADPVILACTRLGPDRLILLIDKEPDKEQNASLKLIQESLGKVIDVKSVKTEVYDIVAVASKCVETIDMQPKDDSIYVNVTSGRKPKALGLLFAAYARHERVSKIAYNPEEDKTSIVYLPRLSFKLSESQKQILEKIENNKYESISDLASKVDLSTAMLYRAIDELKDMDLIESDQDDKAFKITDAGKIARL